jgi:plastocyanin
VAAGFFLGEKPVRFPKTLFITAFCSLALLLIPTAGFAVEPGVDIAAPRVAISQVSDAFIFQPAILVIEQGDWIRWKNVGVSFSHTTTSGFPCVSTGIWNSTLAPGGQFTRQFIESPQALPYYCIPHCGSGMTGQVMVTSRILLQATDSLGQLMLSWTGGGGSYRVFKSDIPAFTGAGTVVFAPNGGDAGTSFTDAVEPSVGGVAYYLVMNKF